MRAHAHNGWQLKAISRNFQICAQLQLAAVIMVASIFEWVNAVDAAGLTAAQWVEASTCYV